MPTPRQHGGAPVFPVPFVTPGFYGLNTQEASSLLGPQWATKVTNAVIDDTGRLGARKGFTAKTAVPLDGTIKQIFEYVKRDGTIEIISTTDSGAYSGISDPQAGDISGGVGITNGNWKFVNFLDECVGFQEGKYPIAYNGSGTFATITEVTTQTNLPTGGVGLSAWGRLWCVDGDGQTIKYTKALDKTDWSGTGSGSFNVSLAWPRGVDKITAMVVHNDRLVIFGREQTLIYVGAEDPNNSLQLEDTLSQVGCVARDSIQEVRGDLWWLSEYGVMSLGRLIQEKSAELSSITRSVQDNLVQYIRDAETLGTLGQIRSVFSPRDRLYLLSFPQNETTFALDTRGLTDRGEARVTQWTIGPSALYYSRQEEILMAVPKYTGVIGGYANYKDNNSDTYEMDYESGWLDLGPDAEPYLKILKRIKSVVNTASASTINFKWFLDFEETPLTTSYTLSGEAGGEWSDTVNATSGEWNDGFISEGATGKIFDFYKNGFAQQWDFYEDPNGAVDWDFLASYITAEGETVLDDGSEWAGGLSLRRFNVPARGTGQYIKIGLTVTINGSSFGLQQLDLITKIGRLA